MQKEFEIEPGIIISKLNIKEDDTIIITIDPDKWGVNEACDISKVMTNLFPYNRVVITFKGVNITIGDKE